MPNAYGGASGLAAGTTVLVVVPAPASDKVRRVVRGMRCFNADTAAVTLTVRKSLAASGMHYVIDQVVLAAGAVWKFGDMGEVLVLTGTDESVTAVLAGAVSSAPPNVTASWEDAV